MHRHSSSVARFCATTWLALTTVAACQQGAPEDADCAALPGSDDRDRCWAEQVSSAALPAPNLLAAARHIQDPELRDLALADAAPGLGLDACQAIRDPVLREGCSTRARRPHLDIPEPAGAVEKPGGATLELDPAASDALTKAQDICEDVPGGLVDLCLQREARREDATVAWALCTGIRDPDLRGDCDASQATRLGETSRGELASRVCSATPVATWRGECFFRLSEALPLAELPAKAGACGNAGRFRDECLRHLVQAQAQASTLRARFGSLSETIEGMERDLAELEEALPTGSDLDWYRFLFGYEGYHALLSAAAQHGSLDAVATAGHDGLDDATRRSWWRDCALKLCVRTHLEAGGGAPSGLTDALAPCQPGRSAPAGPPETPLFPAGPTPSSYRQLAISEVPAPLWPGSGCAVEADARTAIAVLWALEVLPWTQTTAVLDEALDNPAAAVRVYALDMAEHKAFFWHRDDPQGSAWLAERLGAVATSDPRPPIRERAAVLVAGLEAGERPGRWALAAEGACGGP